MEGDTAPAPVRRKTGCPGGYNDPEVVGLETSDENPRWATPFSLRDGYAMPGTDIVYGTISLPTRCAMPGTNPADGAIGLRD
eukprot:1320822-Rhodomonas_salina.3